MMISQPFRCCLVSASTPPRPPVLAGDHVLCEGARRSVAPLTIQRLCRNPVWYRLLPISRPAPLRTRAIQRVCTVVLVPYVPNPGQPRVESGASPDSFLMHSPRMGGLFPRGVTSCGCLPQGLLARIAQEV